MVKRVEELAPGEIISLLGEVIRVNNFSTETRITIKFSDCCSAGVVDLCLPIGDYVNMVSCSSEDTE